MNILPKKSWHVRTRKNIAKVRKDEAKAAEEEKERLRKIELAEKEARKNLLRAQAREKYNYESSEHVKSEVKEEESQDRQIVSSNKHINLFYELDNNDIACNKKNAEHEEEEKVEREKYEKQIGYLTYLGQDTNELTGNVSWYNKSRDEMKDDKHEISMKEKIRMDPLEDMKKYLSIKSSKSTGTTSLNLAILNKNLVKEKKRKNSESEGHSSHKHKKHKKEKRSKHDKKKKKRKKERRCSSSDESEVKVEVKKEPSESIEKLRAERLKREREERARAALLLAKIRGEAIPPKEQPPTEVVTQKYNSQFNPHLAKQNFQ